MNSAMTIELDRGVRIADKYEIIGPLGQGAYGSVYRALQHPVERPVALKVISPHAATDEALRERFFREARAVARLNHPGAVILHDYGESNGLLYMVMELVEGTELKQIIKEEAPLSLDRALDYGRQILSVLIEAHGLDLIHRDLKPANIMIVRDTSGEERIKILDFGIAKLLDDQGARFQTQMGTVVGSPSYFSPEQAMGHTAGRAADQYSLGVILFEMLTGRKPFTGNSLVALINAHRFESVPPLPMELRCPAPVERLIHRAMEKQPEDRFPDAKAMLDALDAVQTGRHLHSDRPVDSRPTMRMDGAAAFAALARQRNTPPPEDDEPKPKQTQPLPGLAMDERAQSGSHPEIVVETHDDLGARPKETLALTALGSSPPPERPVARPRSAPVIDPLATLPETPSLPPVHEFADSETIIKPPDAPSPMRVALLVGTAITVVGLVLIWLLGGD